MRKAFALPLAVFLLLFLAACGTGDPIKKSADPVYTEQGELLYIFTIDEGDIVTTQYYIVKDYGFCLIQLTNFSGSETTEQAARDMVDSFVWDTEG